MIRVYMRCGKCGKYEDATEQAPGAREVTDERQPIMAYDSKGNPYHVMAPPRWRLISIDKTQAVVCADCTPDVIRQIEKAAQ